MTTRMSIAQAAPLIAMQIIVEWNEMANPDDRPAVSSFSEMHDHCDANMLAFEFCLALLGLKEDEEGITGILVDYLNVAQEIVNAYLEQSQIIADASHREAR